MITAWVVINIVTALIAAVIIVYMLGRYGHELTSTETAGWYMSATGLVLRIGPIIGSKVLFATSPFDDWSVSLLHVGLAVAAAGWLWRKDAHRWLRRSH